RLQVRAREDRSPEGRVGSTVSQKLRVKRFTATERWMHWSFAVPFLVLMLTGVMLALPDLEVVLARRELIRTLHLAAAWGLVLLPLLVLVAGDRHALLSDLREIDYWDRLHLEWLPR